MAYTRVATSKNKLGNVKADVIVLAVDGREVKIKQEALDSLTTPTALKREAERQAKKPLDVFFHINRDGSVAMATGAAPEVWPEDVKE